MWRLCEQSSRKRLDITFRSSGRYIHKTMFRLLHYYTLNHFQQPVVRFNRNQNTTRRNVVGNSKAAVTAAHRRKQTNKLICTNVCCEKSHNKKKTEMK